MGGAPYLASLRMDQSQSWQEFVDACSYSRIPAENMVWADRAGNIGYQAVGIAPRRPKWSGLVPVPGDGRYEWNGFLPIKELPHQLNPEKGFYNTSNEYQIPRGWPYKDALHYSWADPFRAQSVAEFLSSGRRFSVADMVQLQNSDLSILARSLVPLLRDIDMPNPASKQAASELLRWNYVLDKDSVAAGIYEMWQLRLGANVYVVTAPKAAQDFLGLSGSRFVSWLYAPDGRFGSDPIASRNALLVQSLEEAVSELSKRFGRDMQKWKLGAYHYARILSPMTDAVKPELQEKFDVGHSPRGGDGYTITATSAIAGNQVAGGSFKIIVDTENWDNSVGLNSPGQSGDVNDPHYRDLYELWARGKYFPIFYSRSKVESVAEKTFQLEPSK